MIPPFDEHGFLPLRIYHVTWPEFVERFATNAHRRRLIEGMRQVLLALRDAGCPRVWIGGSFVTAKPDPADYDICWE